MHKRISICILLFIALSAGFYAIKKTNDLSYIDYKVKLFTDDKEQQKLLSESNKDYYKDETGQTYLITPDPYLYFRLARNLIEIGSINDSARRKYKLIDNSDYYAPLDTLRMAPIGVETQQESMPYLIYYFHKAWNLLSKAELSKTSFYLPVFLGLISISCIFFISYFYFRSRAKAFFSAFVFSLSPIFIAFNSAGYTDTQVITMALSLICMLLFVVILKAKKYYYKIACSILFVFSLIALKNSWRGWFFVIFLVAIFVLLELSEFLREKKYRKTQIILITTALIFIAGFYFEYGDIILQRLFFTGNPLEAHPTSLGSVEELKPLYFKEVVNYLGGWIFSSIIFISIVLLLRRKNRSPFNLFALAWFLLFILLGKISLRFIFFASPSIGFLVSILCDEVLQKVKKINRKYFHLAFIAITLAIIIILAQSISEAWKNGPSMNDAIEEASKFLQENTQKNAVLNVWWDSGYYWQAFSRRGTSIDGALFDSPRAFYLANSFVTNDSELSRDINLVVGCGNDGLLSDSPGFFENKTIEDGLKESVKQINIADCKNEVYLIIDERTFLMAPVLYPYSQKKNETKVELIRELVSKEKFSIGGFKGKDVPFISPIINCLRADDKIIRCGEHLINTETLDFEGKPLNSVAIVKDNLRKEKFHSLKSTNVSLIIYEYNKEYNAVLIDKKIKDSAVVKLFTGEKIAGFENVYTAKKPVRIAVYKVAGNQKTI